MRSQKGMIQLTHEYHVSFIKQHFPTTSTLEVATSLNISVNKVRTIAKKHNVDIWYLESDKDHIHYMIEVEPNTNLANFVKTLKSYTTYHIWKKYPNYLRKCFWKERTFWSDGYFIASIGEVSSDTLKEYIENQGKS